MTITIAYYKSTIDYALPARAKKNKEKKRENYTTRHHVLDLMWSCKFHITSKQDQVDHFCFRMLLFSMSQYEWIPKDLIMPCTAKMENNINANILEAELFF